MEISVCGAMRQNKRLKSIGRCERLLLPQRTMQMSVVWALLKLCSWTMLPLGAIQMSVVFATRLMSMVCAVNEGHVWVYGPIGQRLY